MSFLHLYFDTYYPKIKKKLLSDEVKSVLPLSAGAHHLKGVSDQNLSRNLLLKNMQNPKGMVC